MQTITLRFLGLGLLLSGCATVKKGVVVGKGSLVKPSKFPIIENYWVDVRGVDEDGVRVTERVLLFKKDWQRISKGARIVPADYGVMGLGEAFRKLAKRAKPKPTKRSGHSDSRIAAARKAPPAVAERLPGKTAAAKPAPATEEDFRAVEARAHEDATVREAKRKIHSATTPDEQTRAWEEYRNTLSRKIRELSPVPGERINKAGAVN